MDRATCYSAAASRAARAACCRSARASWRPPNAARIGSEWVRVRLSGRQARRGRWRGYLGHTSGAASIQRDSRAASVAPYPVGEAAPAVTPSATEAVTGRNGCRNGCRAVVAYTRHAGSAYTSSTRWGAMRKALRTFRVRVIANVELASEIGDLVKKNPAWAITGTLLIALSGCMNMPTPPAQITGAYVSPLRYGGLDCARLAVELASLSRRENQLVTAQNQRIKTSEIQAFWFGFGQGDGIEASELANVRGEREAVRSAMDVKGCK